jgi:hypothetical protein
MKISTADQRPTFRHVRIVNSGAKVDRGSIAISDAIAGRRIELPLTFEGLTMDEAVVRAYPEPWNKGKLVGQKAPFKLDEIWAIRVRLHCLPERESLRYSTVVSTASCALAMSRTFKLTASYEFASHRLPAEDRPRREA